MNLDDIIEYDEENTNLDFKREEYKKREYKSLIKDIMSMANAINNEVKRIIIGVKSKPGENKEFIGIDNFTDQATLENIIQENIEPNINFKYFQYNHRGVMLAIIEVYDNYDRPYMMKKDYDTLKKGDMWIRKGSRQSKVTREDVDKMFASRKKIAFEDKITLGFGKKLKNSICISKSNIKKEDFPSSLRKKELLNLIKKLEKRYGNSIDEDEKSDLSPKSNRSSMNLELFGEFIDSNKSIRVGYDKYTNIPVYKNKEQILKYIKNIEKDYNEEDSYYLYEKNSNKFNCNIYNDGTEFLEEVKIEFFFSPNIFIVSKKIYEEPRNDYFLFPKTKISNYRYPKVYKDNDIIVVEEYHKQIRHKTLSNVFYDDLRILIKPKVDIKETIINYKIGAKNLCNPVEGKILVNIV